MASRIIAKYLLLMSLFSPAILSGQSSSSQDRNCGNISVDQCFKQLQTFLRMTSLPFTSKEQELDAYCEQAIGGYNCSSVLYQNQNCLVPDDKALMPVFINMAEYMFFMLCKNPNNKNGGYLREKFLQNSECVLNHKKEMDCCAQETKLPDIPVIRALQDSSRSMAERQLSTCCPVSIYLKCTNQVILDNCGEIAANFSTEYIRRAAGEQLQGICQEMPMYPEPDPKNCVNPNPSCSGSSKISISFELIVLFIFFITFQWL